MATDGQKPGTRLRDYVEILRSRDANGLPFILVGGHAVNFWAEYYYNASPALTQYLPFTSKDLDIIGSGEEAVKIARSTGWFLTPPVVGGGPVQAVLSSEPDGGGLKAEVLSHIKGVPAETIFENARSSSIVLNDTEESIQLRVLDPILLFAGKIRNAVDIEQDLPDKPRQDVKHAAILSLCIPVYIGEVASKESTASMLKFLTMLTALKNSYSGRTFQVKYPGVVHWGALLPPIARQSLKGSANALLAQFDG